MKALTRRRAPIAVRAIRPRDRQDIEQILIETGVFKEFEVDVALELVDAYYEAPDQDYTALGAFTRGGKLVGYVCYGPTPMTEGTWDLYWIAVSPEVQGNGVGTRLLQEVERRLALQGARLVIIETSSQPMYAPTCAFYERHHYDLIARVPDFYAPGDDRLIFVKRILNSSAQG